MINNTGGGVRFSADAIELVSNMTPWNMANEASPKVARGELGG